MDKKQNSVQRNFTLDFLKCIAFLCIILAHTNPPDVVFRIRNLDVTMMVLLSGTSFYLSRIKRPVSYGMYLKKRIQRLILPTWWFLCVFFLFFTVLCSLTHRDLPFTGAKVAESFALVDGIGYVWIMRIYFLCAVISPAAFRLSSKTESTHFYFAFLLVVYIGYLGVCSLVSQLDGIWCSVLQNTVVDALGWGLICAVGIRLKCMDRKTLVSYALVFSLIHIFLMHHYGFASTQNWKYPPRLYYTSYGIAATFWMYAALQSSVGCRLQSMHLLQTVCTYISKHSIQMYFWHIAGIYLIKLYGTAVPVLMNSFVLKFCFLLFFSFVGAMLQERIQYVLHHYRMEA